MDSKDKIYDDLATITAVGGKEYAKGVLRDLYITSKEDINLFARRYKLKVSELRTWVEGGKWDEERITIKKSARSQLLKKIDQSVQLQAEIELKLQALELIKAEQQIDFLMQYYAQHGDLYVRNPQTGVVMYEGSGQPKMMPLPSSMQDVSKRKGLAELLQGFKKILKVQELELGPESDDINTFDMIDGDVLEAQKLLNMAKNSND